MGLRSALEALESDRQVTAAARTVMTYLASHRDELLTVERIASATTVSAALARRMVDVFASNDVLADRGDGNYAFAPSTVLDLEVERYLRARATPEARLQRGAERFRGRYGMTQ